MLAVTGLQVLCSVGATYCAARTGTGFGRDLRSAIFGHIIGFGEPEAAGFGAPSLLTRTTNDVRQLQVLVQMSTTVLVTAPIMSVGGVVMAVHQDAGLSWLLLAAVPVLAGANYAIVRRMLPMFRRMQSLIDNLNRVLRDQLTGIRVIRAFDRQQFEAHRFDQANRAMSDTALAVGNWQAVLLPVTTLTINASSVAVIWFGGLRIDAGQMQVGSLIAFLAYFMQILMAVTMATMTLAILPRASVCAERIGDVLAARPSVTAPARPTPAGRGPGVEIRLVDVTYAYPGADRPVLREATLTAPAGTTTAVVGSTGSGKSTLVSLICRLRDVTAGAVLIDGIDVRDYDPQQLWARIGLVPQHGYLFAGTVADNLRYGAAPDRQVGDEQLWRALQVAAADDFVADHPDGLQMKVAQGGINLSGGQRQRLAIARAVIGAPALYLFADAFSALDGHTDSRVRAALRQVAADATVFIVAQRISTVVDADQIVVVDDGRVVGVGNHHTLLAQCPAYAELADSQQVNVQAGGSR